MEKWRWDQGRLLYLSFDNIRLIAKALVKFDGINISLCEQDFRHTLEETTGLPFSPRSYTIKRNYSRVFQIALLANFVDNRLIVTDFCRELADQNGVFLTADDYFVNYMNHFRYPFPAFKEYDSGSISVYPFCAIVKLLLAMSDEMFSGASIDVDSVCNMLISNHCTGFEDIGFYKKLKVNRMQVSEDERRQVREMLVFISQLSFLKMHNHSLYLDIDNDFSKKEIQKCINPYKNFSSSGKTEDFFAMTRLNKQNFIIPSFETEKSNYNGLEIKEGERKRVEHIRIERSPLLKRYYKDVYPEPICRACNHNMRLDYHWTEYMLEVHHLLPLSMSIGINANGTSLNDLVGLCPNCHRAVHLYYSMWLKENNRKDFANKVEAHTIYEEAVKQIRI